MGTGNSPFSQSPDTVTALQTIGLVVIYLLAAVLVSLLSRTLARPFIAIVSHLPGKQPVAAQRQETVESLVASLISLMAFIVAALGIFSLFVDSERLIWVIGLFSAAFGLAARSLVADILAGTRFIFRNTFAIGEKVELSVGGVTAEGIIEEVNVTNTMLRAPTGESYVVPNGDILVIRNFSRAPHSAARVKLVVESEQLGKTIAVLEEMSQSASSWLPELIEPFQVLSTSDSMSNRVELTVMAHCSFGKAATVKLRLMDLIYRRLREAEVELLD